MCRARPGAFYYRGVRLSDGAGIELANAVRSSGGFDVTSPTDGTRYLIRLDGLTIIPPDGQSVTEPMVEYATSRHTTFWPPLSDNANVVEFRRMIGPPLNDFVAQRRAKGYVR